MRMAEELSDKELLQTSSEILLPEMCRALPVAFAESGLEKMYLEAFYCLFGFMLQL